MEDFSEDVHRMANQLRQLVKVLPELGANEVMASIDQNFQKGGFYGDPWEKRKNDEDPDRAILIGKGSGRLRRSIDYEVKGKTIYFKTDAPYAEIHNEGGQIAQEITITNAMRKFFWAKYYETEDDKWKYMALSKKAYLERTINMPQRQFMGDNPEVDRMLNSLLEHEINRIFG
ncbi:phage virion morphogenesis protein [Rufibacter quisquiliarum]|uniref:Phage gpG-like protein n=1 Tax=Rufibacter quisquiliarum TaxID=1549639 RepID=A0A839GU13_9BACT|nr:phage virion morphogenesis protein [Rufibacter quisquiliarum]MBA9078955.1 phage gpG-like protein [Rufibacter quisquiliarum]